MDTVAMDAFRPRLSAPFTLLGGAGRMYFVAGEDLRYALRAPDIGTWLPAVLARCDGRHTAAEAVAHLAPETQSAALVLLGRLIAERVLVDGSAADAHAQQPRTVRVQGRGALADRLRATWPDEPVEDAPLLLVYCQDRLDLQAALAVNRRARESGAAWIWATTGPMARGYVSPVFLPDAGPCLACLIAHFRRVSPAPEVYSALLEHARAGREVVPVSFPQAGEGILAELVRWKCEALADVAPQPALYRLHVVEARSLEVATHAVFRDPECEECGHAGLA